MTYKLGKKNKTNHTQPPLRMKWLFLLNKHANKTKNKNIKLKQAN